MFKNPEKYDETMQNMLETYGIENDGVQWCKNCGSK